MGKRGPKPTLTDRDKQVIEDLYRARCMTGMQLQKAVFGGESQHGKRRLRVLMERKLLNRFSYAKNQFDKTGSFNFDGYVYELTDEGVLLAEEIVDERVITGDTSRDASYSALVHVEPRKIARYLQTAEVYLETREKVEWIPHYMIRYRLQTDDFTIGCMAAVERNGVKGLLFGTNTMPHLNVFKAYQYNIRNAAPLGFTKSVIMCPDFQTVVTAVEYFKEKILEGDVFVMTYVDAQDDLPFVMERKAYYGILVNELRRRFGRKPVVQVTGRYPTSFEWMIEYEEGVYGYLADVSGGNLEVLYDLIDYNYSEAKNEQIHNEGLRVVFALVRDQQQLEWLQSQLDSHSHVRLIMRKSEGELPWYGSRDGDWYPLRLRRQQQNEVVVK